MNYGHRKKFAVLSPLSLTMTGIPQLLVKRLSDNAKLPTRGSAAAAGYDLYRCVYASGMKGRNGSDRRVCAAPPIL